MKKDKLVLLLVMGCMTLITFNSCTNKRKDIKDAYNFNKYSEGADGNESIGEYDPILMLVNDEYWVSESFVPSNLEKVNIPFSGAASEDEMYMEYEAAKAIEKLVDGALKDDIYLYGVSGYRPYELQKYIYEVNVANNGQEYTNDYVAIPGRSEHQIGLAMDLGDSTGNLIENSEEVDWVNNNAHLYGFILRYPKGKEEITGYKYESWHIRYVGVNVATKIYSENITLEEYYDY